MRMRVRNIKMLVHRIKRNTCGLFECAIKREPGRKLCTRFQNKDGSQYRISHKHITIWSHRHANRRRQTGITLFMEQTVFASGSIKPVHALGTRIGYVNHTGHIHNSHWTYQALLFFAKHKFKYASKKIPF